MPWTSSFIQPKDPLTSEHPMDVSSCFIVSFEKEQMTVFSPSQISSRLLYHCV